MNSTSITKKIVLEAQYVTRVTIERAGMHAKYYSHKERMEDSPE